MIILGTPQMLRSLPAVTINFSGSVITDSRIVKNLGLIMDRHLSFEAHVDSVQRKCTGLLIALSHARHTIPKAFLAQIVQGLVISIVRYCISIYGSCNLTQTRRIQKIINFGARVVTGKRKTDHISHVIRELRWLSAEQLVQYHTVCTVFHAITTGRPAYIASTIGAPGHDTHGHDTRQSSNLALPRIRTEAGRRRLCYRGTKLYNDIQVERNRPFRAALRRAVMNR